MTAYALPTRQIARWCFPRTLALSTVLAQRYPDTALHELQSLSEALQASVLARTHSRVGRSQQRWLADGEHNLVRLVAGSIPIFADGRVLLVSSKKKKEWVLPKGGWESDETLEESALRESFEEAGVTGILGPPLKTVWYEPAKSKRKVNNNNDIFATPKGVHELFDEGNELDRPGKALEAEFSDYLATPPSAEPKIAYKRSRMTLFPLFVQEVRDVWPESTRLRRLATIDEAIEALASRPAFQSVLLEVKERGLHLVATNGYHSSRRRV